MLLLREARQISKQNQAVPVLLWHIPLENYILQGYG